MVSKGENGTTLIELLMVLALGTILLSMGVVYSIPMLLREGMRDATYDVQTFFQLARIEAVSRSRDCRFVVDTTDGTLQVLDSMGTGTSADDVVLYKQTLSEWVVFLRPDMGPAVTLSPITATTFQSVFSQDGTVSLGAGDVVMFGGDHYRRVSLFAAGGLQVQHWNGGSWEAGS